MASFEHAGRIAARQIDARHEIARNELSCAMMRIFSPRIRGRKRAYLETTMQYRGVTVEIRGPELDAFDLGVLLAVYAVAGRDVDDRDTCAARGLLATDPTHTGASNAAADMPSLRVRTTVAEIAAMIGRDSRDGGALKRIRAAIARLMSVVISGARGDEWGATQLILRPSDEHGRLTLDLNYRATRAVLGDGQWVAVSMQRWRACKKPLERVLLHRIATLTTGRPVPVGIDTLAKGCWADAPRDDHDLRSRRQQVTKAVAAGRCVPTGITAQVDERGIVTFRRAV